MKILRQSNVVMTLLTFILALSIATRNVHSSAHDKLYSISTSNQLNHYPCNNQANNKGGDYTITPDWIHSSSHDVKNNIGILETPNFPKRFPLPLRCVWIFDNTAMNNTHEQQQLFIYFTRVIISL